jgi:hypothetical protein
MEVSMNHQKLLIGTGLFRLAIGVFTLALAVSWGGCNGCHDPAAVSAAASSLDVNFAVSDITETPSDGKVVVVMQFLQNGTLVQLASDAVVTCNGVPLTYNGLLSGHAARVPLVPTGGTYTFTHTRSAVVTNVNITVPPRPVFVAPTVNGATLARTNNFTIHYVAGTGVSVIGYANDATHGLNNTQPDNGAFTGLDVSGFTAGPGTLSIQRHLEIPHTGTGFHSAMEKFFISKTAAITWQ